LPEAEIHIAAIDVGSNGIRLAIAELTDESRPGFRIIRSERAAVRLGEDAFSIGRLTPKTIDRTVTTLQSFWRIMDDHHVTSYRAVATSAARECQNREELVNAALKTARVRIQIIGGLEEADLLFRAVATQFPIGRASALMIDMGGGSVELTVARNGHAVGAETLPLGPVRLLQKLNANSQSEKDAASIIENYAQPVCAFVEAELSNSVPPGFAFGAGGNIESLAKLRSLILGKSNTGKLKITDLQKITPVLLSMSPIERLNEFDLRPDRADVIAIAAVVLHMIMGQAAVPRLMVPGLGIKDGILAQLASKSHS